MSDRFPEFLAKVIDASLNAADITGQVIVEYGRSILDTPVERLGGGVVVRSQPGEPPRTDEGDLLAELQHDVDKPTANEVKLTFTTSRFSTPGVPWILETGVHPIAARPYFWAEEGSVPSMRTQTQHVGIGIVTGELKKVR